MIQAIFFDVDGTLVSFRTHTIPASTLEALHALRAKGDQAVFSHRQAPGHAPLRPGTLPL